MTNHYGYQAKEDGIHFRYQVDDFDAVQAAIAAYPVAYRAVMVPKMLHEVSQTREIKVGSFVFNGMSIPLNLETRSNLTSAVVGLERNGEVEAINWSRGNGVFITIPRAVLFAMADAAFLHVQACFDAQKAIVEQIAAAADIEVLRAIDIPNHEAWPN